MTRWLLFAALLLGAAWWLRRKPPMTPWPLYREGDDGLLPVDPWPQSQTYTFPDGSIFLIGEPGDPWTLVQADPTYTWLGEPVRR